MEKGTYTVKFNIQAKGTTGTNRSFFIGLFDEDANGNPINVSYPVFAQHIANGNRTYTYTNINNTRKFMTFGYYLSTHNSTLPNRFFTLDNLEITFTGNLPVTTCEPLYSLNGNEEGYRFGFNGHERTDELYGKGNLNTALFWHYDTRLGRRWNLDPVTKPWISSYHAFSNKPITFIDPNGDNANPIIDDETGDLLGTDEKGLQGEAIIMNKSEFKQGMKHGEAINKGTLVSDLDLNKFSKDVIENGIKTINSLSSRPDWDGKVTLKEANKWYRESGGKPLYVKLASIDFTTSYESDVDENGVINLFFTQSLLSQINGGGGNVYCSIIIKVSTDLSISAPFDYYDTYNFDQKPWGYSPARWLRNIGTYIGESKAGEGNDFNIYFYGKSKLASRQSIK